MAFSLQYYGNIVITVLSLGQAQDTTASAGPDGEAAQGFLQLGAEREREARIPAGLGAVGLVAEDTVMLRNTAALSASKKMGTLVLLSQENEITQHSAVGHRGKLTP